MHALLILASLTIATASGIACWGVLRLARSWDSRRSVQITGLALPVVVLGLLALALLHFLSDVCFVVAPTLDVIATETLALLGAAAVALAVLLNIGVTLILPVRLRSTTWEPPLWLLDAVDDLASELRAPLPVVRVSPDARPWALTAGVVRPYLVVSSGLLSLLDREELMSVLCHELLHVRRADLLWSSLANALRDLTWFLPATRKLYGQLLLEQEMACDDQIWGESRRLALASALARVWQARLSLPSAPRGSLYFMSVETNGAIETRARRLLELPGTPGGARTHRGLVLSLMLLGAFVMAQLTAIEIAMRGMGCSLFQLWAMLPFAL